MTTPVHSAIDLAAATNTTVHTVAGAYATLNINVANRNATAVKIRLAVAATAIPAAAEWIEYDVSIPANGVLERTAIVVPNGQNIVAYSDTAGVSVNVWGFEA